MLKYTNADLYAPPPPRVEVEAYMQAGSSPSWRTDPLREAEECLGKFEAISEADLG
jgi:hypothetical protein